MWNLGGGEVMVVLLLALLVLGPQKLPETARQIGRFTSQVRSMANGFRQEIQAVIDEPIEAAARSKGATSAGLAAPAPEGDATGAPVIEGYPEPTPTPAVPEEPGTDADEA